MDAGTARSSSKVRSAGTQGLRPGTPCISALTSYFLLVYEATGKYAEERKPFRAEHLKLAQAAVDAGELVFGGALANPVDGAVLLFRGPTAEAAERFARNDPYVVNGVVRKWHVREWTVVVGER